MLLRGHHLICLLGFRGMGYNKKFIYLMSEIIDTLISNPDTKIQVVKEIDIVCSVCPNRKEVICYANENEKVNQRMQSMDEIVLNTLGLDENRTYTFLEISNRIKERFTTDHMEKLCKQCEWHKYGYCDKGLRALKSD